MHSHDDELLVLAEALGEVKTKTEKLEAEFSTQARPLEAATNALSATLSGIKALQFHVIDNNLGALSARVEEMRKAVDEQVGVIALELKKADESNAAKAGQEADALRSEIAGLQAQLGTLGAQFEAQLARVEFAAKEEAKKLQLIPGPAGEAGASLNPRGTFIDGQTYNRLDVVSWLGSSYIATVDGVTEKPSKTSTQWQVLASRGNGGGGTASLNDMLGAPSAGTIVGSEGSSYVRKTLVAGANIAISETPSTITITGTEGEISLEDGSAASPSLFFTNDPDTGIYRPGSNQVGISLGGSAQAVLTSTTFTVTPNLVVSGTGTSSIGGNATVAGTLTVNGAGTSSFQSTTPSTVEIANTTSGLSASQFAANGVVLGTLKFGHPSDGEAAKFPSIVGQFNATDASFARKTWLNFYTSDASGNNLVASLTDNKNLLIGGTTDISGTSGLKVFGTTASTSTSTGALVVSGGLGVAGNLNIGGELQISSAYPAFKLTDTNSNSDFTILNDNGRLAVYDETNAAYRLTIGATGGVKIGTTPEDVGANNLTVQGTLAVSGGSVTLTGAAYSIFYADGSSGGNFTIRKAGVAYGTLYGNETNTVLDSAGSANLIFQTGGATRGTFTSSGLTVNATTASTSTSTGALVVSGGVGVASNLNVGGTLNQFGTIGTPSQVAVAMQHTLARFRERSVTNDFAWTTNIDDGWVQDNSSYASWGIRMGGGSNTFRIGQKAAGGAGDLSTLLLLNSTGNLLIGTTTDIGGKLQINKSNGGNVTGAANAAIYLPTDESTIQGPGTYTQIRMGGNLVLGSSNETLIQVNQVNAIKINSSQQVQVPTTTASTSTSTGALVVSGGVGVAKEVYVGKTCKVGTGSDNEGYTNVFTNKAENTAGPFDITLPSDCVGVVFLNSYQSGVGRSFREIPFICFGGTVTLGTSRTTVLTADPVTSVAAAASSKITISLYAGNTNCYWGIYVNKS